MVLVLLGRKGIGGVSCFNFFEGHGCFIHEPASCVLMLFFKLMAGSDAKDELEWMRRLRSEGAVPQFEPDNCWNGWAPLHGDNFRVRGPEYFSTRVKIPGGACLLQPLGFDWFKGSVKIGEILNHPNSRVRKVLQEEFPGDDKPFVWAFNLQVPIKETYAAIAYFVTRDPIPEGSLMDQFLKGDGTYRKSRLKLIANIAKGPWIVRKAVGEQAICILGRSLSCKYFLGENFLEVDIDIGSSMVASAIVHLAFGYITTLTVDLAFLIESQTEAELPERILGAIRFSELNPSSAQPFEQLHDLGVASLPSSLPSRFWKSLGSSFSNLMHSGGQEAGSLSSSPRANGEDHQESGKMSMN
ncbi:ENHANCED DISEASE RESISTANCE 2-like protein [Drosera capensis]